MSEDKKKIFVLVGPPSVGKSTWIKSTFSKDKPYIINRDDIVENVASSMGWSYDDLFVNPPADSKIGDVDEKYGEVVKSPPFIRWSDTSFNNVLDANNKVHSSFMNKVSGAASSGKNIVVDMTNMSAGSRKAAMNAISGKEEEYEKIAVVFEFEGIEDIIKKVAKKRAEAAKRMGKSKTIPDAAFDRMFGSYEAPSKSEGFDQIISVDNSKILKELIEEGKIVSASDMGELRFASVNEALRFLYDALSQSLRVASDDIHLVPRFSLLQIKLIPPYCRFHLASILLLDEQLRAFGFSQTFFANIARLQLVAFL
jgi:hypothetical protein